MTASTQATYQAGDEIDINGTTIILASQKSFSGKGIRWTWDAPDLGASGVAYKRTAEEAITDARNKLAPTSRCRCGAAAEMTASTGPACANCYDDLAD
jgi:hypothetical protein